MEASTFEARADRHLTCTPLLLDHSGWDRVIEAIDGQFVSLFEEQNDARLRASHSGEELIRASIVLIAFESPMSSGRIGPSLVESRKEPLVPFPLRLSKVFADEGCMKIIAELNLRAMSATQFHREFGVDSLDGIRRRFKLLERIGWLTKIDEKSGGRRRGGTEKFYRATGPAILDRGPWDDIPDSFKEMSSWSIFERFSERVREAVVAGTFDARADRYLTWSLLSLDQEGWEKVTAAMEGLLEFIVEEKERAGERMKSSGESPVTMTVALAAFESPMESVKEP
jgi:hypothetical protein